MTTLINKHKLNQLISSVIEDSKNKHNNLWVDFFNSSKISENFVSTLYQEVTKSYPLKKERHVNYCINRIKHEILTVEEDFLHEEFDI